MVMSTIVPLVSSVQASRGWGRPAAMHLFLKPCNCCPKGKRWADSVLSTLDEGGWTAVCQAPQEHISTISSPSTRLAEPSSTGLSEALPRSPSNCPWALPLCTFMYTCCSAWRTEGSGETLNQPSSTWRGTRAYRKAGEGPFTRARSDITRGNGFKLKEGRFRLDISKKFFTVRVVRYWNRLPREAVNAPSLAVFKARSDGALSNLVWWKVSLTTAGGLELEDL